MAHVLGVRFVVGAFCAFSMHLAVIIGNSRPIDICAFCYCILSILMLIAICNNYTCDVVVKTRAVARGMDGPF